MPEERTLLEADVTEHTIGAFYHVYRSLGFGFLEGNYANALAVALDRRGLRVTREVPVEVMFEGVAVGRYRLDMIVEGRVLIEIKATKSITDADKRQVLNYLKATDLEVGLLLHFGPAPSFRRYAYANSRKRPASAR